MKRFLTAREHPGELALFLLILRLQMGLAFVFHGWPKIQDPTGWMGPASGYPVVLLVLAAVAEFVGGACLALGLLTRLAAFGIGATMVFAVLHHMGRGDGFVGDTGSWEVPALYLSLSLVFFLKGPGRSSIDASLFHKK